MRFCLLLLFASFILLTNNYSQVNLGVVGGFNFNFDNIDMDEIETSSLFGYGIGGIFEIEFNKELGIKIEPTFMTKGTNYEIYDSRKTEVEREYIEIPILMIYKFDGNIKPYILSGISLGMIFYEHHSNINLEATTTTSSKNSDLEMSFLIGGGLSYRPYLSPFNFFIESRYSLGLTSVSSEYIEGYGSLQSAKDIERTNSGFGIFFGFTFSLNY